MREIPILFSSPMVRALLNTRRGSWPPEPIDPANPCKGVTRRLSKQWLKAKAGDRLWVRETWAAPHEDKTRPERIAYNADGLCGCWCGDREDRCFIAHGRVLEADGYRTCFPKTGAETVSLALYTDIRRGQYPSYRYGWRPSIFMPRWACRIELVCLEDARPERLQEISEYDAELDGVHRCDPIGKYRELWSTLHTKPGERWEDNPELVRVGPFRRIC